MAIGEDKVTADGGLRTDCPWDDGRARSLRVWVLIVGLVCAGVAWGFDAGIAAWASGVRDGLGGDVRRELEAAQQFGGVGSLVVVVMVVWLLDPRRRRRLLDLLAGVLVTGVVVQVLKMGIGRPRPKFEDAGFVLGPWGRYPIVDGEASGVYAAWEVWEPISSDLWSMPSSHTSAAVALAVWLGVVYPRIRPLMVGWVVVVGGSRVLFGAHYLSDVFVGAGVGFVSAHLAVRGYWGVRAVDWIWVRVVDRGAEPALSDVLRQDERRSVGEATAGE